MATPPEPAPHSIAHVAPSGAVKRRRSRWINSVAAILVGFVLTAGLAYRYWLSTPQYSLLQAKGAFETHDLTTFEKYVAINRCADALTNDVFAEALAKSRAQSADDVDPFAAAGRKMAEGLMMLLKPAIATVLKTKSREFISTGQLNLVNSGSQNSTGPVDLEAIKNNILKDGLHFEGMRTLGVENNTATVELNFHNTKKNTEQPLQLEMQRTEGYWQVSRWKNATDWIKGASPSASP